MKPEYSLRRGAKVAGPLSLERILQMKEEGKLRDTDRIRRNGESRWQPLSYIDTLTSTSETPPPSIPPRRGLDEAATTVAVKQGEKFSSWYRSRFVSRFPWYLQVVVWATCGFVWIPLWYLATATESKGIYQRWRSLPFSGKAITSLPLAAALLPLTLKLGSEFDSLSRSRAESNSSAVPVGSVGSRNSLPDDDRGVAPDASVDGSRRLTHDSNVDQRTSVLDARSVLPDDVADAAPLPIKHLNVLNEGLRTSKLRRGVRSLSYDHDSRKEIRDQYLLIGNNDSGLALLDVSNDEIVRPSDSAPSKFATPAGLSPSGRFLACLNIEQLDVWDIDENVPKLESSYGLPSDKYRTFFDWKQVYWDGENTVFLRGENGPRWVVARFDVANENGDGRFILDSDELTPPYEGAKTTPLGFLPNTQSILIARESGIQRVAVDRPMFPPGNPFHDPDVKTRSYENEAVPAGLLILRPSANDATPVYSFEDSETVWHGLIGRRRNRAEGRRRSVESLDPAQLSLDGSRLSAAVTSGDRVELLQFDTSSWTILSRTELPSTFASSGSRGGNESGLLKASPSGRFFVGYATTKKRTNQGERTQTDIHVVDTVNGTPIARFSSPGLLLDVACSDDESVFAVFSLHEEWVQNSGRQEFEWKLVRLDPISGEVRFEFFGRGALPPAVGAESTVAFTESGSFVTFGDTIWPTASLELISKSYQQANQLYRQRNWNTARKYLAELLLDPAVRRMWWWEDEVFPDLWGKCFDCYIAEGRESEAEKVLDYCDVTEVLVRPASEFGEAALSRIRNKQDAEQRETIRKEQERAAAELALLRQQNSTNRIYSKALTKSEFVQELRNTMTRGQIDNYITTAVFDNYAFQDKIGEPDRNVALPKHRRYFVYYCLDGNVGITVTVINDVVILHGLDLL